MILGELHILDDEMNELPRGEPGTLWFKSGSPFAYFNDVEKTKESTSSDGSLVTVGDVGYLDDDDYLFLTDRATFMIISGGVNIYPQETENLLITHPKVADAAVFGVPNTDLGEEVKAVVQLMPDVAASPDVSEELIDFCRANLAHPKCPRSIDFMDQLPRLPTGKLYKRVLRDRYWAEHQIQDRLTQGSRANTSMTFTGGGPTWAGEHPRATPDRLRTLLVPLSPAPCPAPSSVRVAARGRRHVPEPRPERRQRRDRQDHDHRRLVGAPERGRGRPARSHLLQQLGSAQEPIVDQLASSSDGGVTRTGDHTDAGELGFARVTQSSGRWLVVGESSLLVPEVVTSP